jgi:hypothetical protein
MATNPHLPVTLDELIATVLTYNPEGDALVHLGHAVLVSQALDEHADQLVGHFVDEARRTGASWAMIGQGLGVSKQAAQQRFVVDDLDMADLGRGLFTRFTERARHAVEVARDEAQRLAAAEVESAHLVLGLLTEKDGIAGRALQAQGVTLAVAHARFPEPAKGSRRAPGFAREAKKSIQLSLREALKLGHNYIGTEHLLLGVLSERDSSGARLLAELGVDAGATRAEIAQLLASAKPVWRRRARR